MTHVPGHRTGHLLVIDPCMVQPENEAYNNLNRFFGELSMHAEFSLSCVQFLIPHLAQTRLSEIAANMDIAGIISLGSLANVTDNHPWIDSLRQDLLELLLPGKIPFLGICFSHQLLAHSFGNEVGYLTEASKYPAGKQTGFRRSQVVHPKLGLLFADMLVSDYFSNNRMDASFQKTLHLTRSWTHKEWQNLTQIPESRLSAHEKSVISFLSDYVPRSFVARVSHEQEVLEITNDTLAVAATSPECKIDALVHETFPIYSVQCHPETWHETGDGWRLLRNFIYLTSCYRSEDLKEQ